MRPWQREPLHHIRFGTSYILRFLAILSERAQVVPQQIVSQGPHGHRTVRLHKHKTLSLALTLMHYTDPIFFLHHAVSNH